MVVLGCCLHFETMAVTIKTWPVMVYSTQRSLLNNGALTECFQSARVSVTHSRLTEFRTVEGVDARLTSA